MKHASTTNADAPKAREDATDPPPSTTRSTKRKRPRKPKVEAPKSAHAPLRAPSHTIALEGLTERDLAHLLTGYFIDQHAKADGVSIAIAALQMVSEELYVLANMNDMAAREELLLSLSRRANVTAKVCKDLDVNEKLIRAASDGPRISEYELEARAAWRSEHMRDERSADYVIDRLAESGSRAAARFLRASVGGGS